MDCLMLSTVEYFRFKTDLYQTFIPLYYRRYITEIILFENQANRVLLFLASDHGFVYSKMREDCLQKNIMCKEHIIRQKTIIHNSEQPHPISRAFGRVP